MEQTEEQKDAEADSVEEAKAEKAETKEVQPQTVLHNAYRGRK